MKKLAVAAVGAAMVTFSAVAAFADPIVGNWKTGDGVLVGISKCGSSFCVDVLDGEYAGKRSGKLKKDGKGYKGTLKQFSTGISFSGSATISGSSMNLVAKKFGVTVKRDKWRKQ